MKLQQKQYDMPFELIHDGHLDFRHRIIQNPSHSSHSEIKQSIHRYILRMFSPFQNNLQTISVKQQQFIPDLQRTVTQLVNIKFKIKFHTLAELFHFQHMFYGNNERMDVSEFRRYGGRLNIKIKYFNHILYQTNNTESKFGQNYFENNIIIANYIDIRFKENKDINPILTFIG